jgi:hypothetical protein
MANNCLHITLANGCWTKADLTKESVFVHNSYGKAPNGQEVLRSTRYTTVDGTVLTIPLTDTVTVGACEECSNKIFATHDRYYYDDVAQECYTVQEIKEKDSCTGLETYRYVTEDGNGILVDASVFIPNFDEDNIVFNCPEDPKVEYIPHVSGCIRRKTGTITATCSSTTTTYDFSDTDMVGFTITANDGNGNYTIIQEQANTIAHDKFLALLQNVSQTNARTVEDIGPGFIMFNFWSGNVSNVIDYSPTEVQFEIHVEAGVSDTPVALTVPCVDPIPDSTYQSSATALRSIYDPVPLNTQQANSGTALIFTVTNYTVSYEVIGGSDIIIPAKQILYKDIDGTIIEEFRSVGNISSLIIFNPITDTFSINCEKDPLPNVQEKEVCGTIDGSTSSYELIRIYTRNPLTGLMSVIHYEDNFGNVVSGTIVEVCCDCNTLCEVTPSLLPVNMRCDSYSRSNNVNNSLQNQGGWLSGYNNTLYFDKWSNTATYDLLMNDLGQPSLVGAPRNLQYQISGEINGNTFSGTVTIPVPTAGTPLSLANQINAIVGANVLDYDGYGWSFQYNSAWTSYSLLIGELADNHAGGFQDISFGWKWAVRLNAGVLEDGIGVDPNNLNNGNWFSAANCVSI